MRSKNAFKKTYQHFYERQRYKNLFLLLLLILVEGILIYFVLQEVLADNLWGSKKKDTWLLIGITLLVPTPLLLSFYFIRLDTIVTEEGIFYRWVPFRKNYNMILWDNIREVFIVDMQQAGWRWRVKNKYDEINFPGSDHALVIQLKSGRKKLIGTRKAAEMNRVLIRNSGNRYQSTFVEQFDFD
jgi:hypothetical protein